MSLGINMYIFLPDTDFTPNASVIPGMGLEYGLPEHLKPEGMSQ